MQKKGEKIKVAKPASEEFAVIKTGGKQYKVAPGEFLRIEKLKVPSNLSRVLSREVKGMTEYKVGDKISFDKVLLVDDGSNTTIGTPYIKDAKVEGELVELGRTKKVTIIKYKSKVRYFKKRGHRQSYFKVKITSIK